VSQTNANVKYSIEKAKKKNNNNIDKTSILKTVEGKREISNPPPLEIEY
jgi:hypothetical protein